MADVLNEKDDDDIVAVETDGTEQVEQPEAQDDDEDEYSVKVKNKSGSRLSRANLTIRCKSMFLSGT